MKNLLIIMCLTLCALAGCQSTPAPRTQEANQRANQLFDEFFSQWLALSPNFQTYLGIKDDYDKWDDLSEAHAQQRHQLYLNQLRQLQQIEPDTLSGQTQLSYRLMQRSLEMDIASHQWRLYDYPVNQMFGWHTSVPSTLINQHTITSVEDAQDYISRIGNVETLFAQLNEALDLRAAQGIILPSYLFPAVIEASENVIQGAPFTAAEPSPILSDFETKVAQLDISEQQKEALIDSAKQALVSKLEPAYRSLIAKLQSLQQRADARSGVWKFPRGEQFYNFALQRTTTTELSAEQIHQIGLEEVARIHKEMRNILERVNFEGDLPEFFEFIRTDPQFYYPNTDQGRQDYLQHTQEVIDAMSAQLDQAFITKPKSPLKVKRVEAFREKSAGKAFYQAPPPDGSRPGIYYVNLYDMSSVPKYDLEALAYHEGLPGHHLQLSISSELKDLPRFRKYGGYTAYVEGWGLYSELLPKEMGFYQDPYADFGRLAMELWRACRLVTDTGLHAKKWSREQAIDYLEKNTPNSEGSIKNAIERYIVIPSQATAYKIGMMKILELRQQAQNDLGKDYSIREFHEVVLGNGALPLDALETAVDEWINSKK